MSSFVVYLWREARNVAIVSTEDEEFAKELMRWAEEQGYRAVVRTHKISEVDLWEG